jgi:autoinducer 2-degrading protein
MLVNVVTAFIKAEHVADFIAATRKNHEGTRKEPGNHRFDVLQSAGDPTRFLLYEVFENQDAVEAHRRTVHYAEWKAAVEGWMAKPRELHGHRIIAPENPDAW